MDIGKLFRDGWGLFTKDVGPLIVGMLIACIVPAVAMTVVIAVTIGASLGGISTNAQGEITSVDSSSIVVWVVGSVVIAVVALLLTVPLFAGLLEGVLLRVRQGRPMAYGDAFNGFRIFGRVVGAAVLLGVIYGALVLVPTAVIVAGGVTETAVVVGVGVLFLVAAIVFYVYLFVRWLYVFPVIVDKGAGVGEAMSQSTGLVRRRWWWTLLAYFVLSLTVGAVSTVLGFIPFVGAVATIVLYPFVLTYVVAMYFQARGEGELIDVVTGYVAPGALGGAPAYSHQAAPYVPAAAAPMPPAPPAARAVWQPPAGGTAWQPPEPPSQPPVQAPASGAAPPGAAPPAYSPAPPPTAVPPADASGPPAAEQPAPAPGAASDPGLAPDGAPTPPEAPAPPEPPRLA